MSADTFEAARKNHPNATFTDWLRGELDRPGPDLSPRRHRRVARHFRRTMTLERAFFDVPCESRTAHDGPDRREQFGTVNFPDPVIRSR